MHKNDINELEEKMLRYNRIAKSIINDIYSKDDTISESKIVRKIELENNIQKFSQIMRDIDIFVTEFKEKSERWKKNRADANDLPKDKYTKIDIEKIRMLRDKFVENLILFGYKSTTNFNTIQISEERLLPIIEDFDMKFDSSASDGIRAIWAYILALMESSIKYGGNHSKLLIFDEPTQHNIVAKDTESFFKVLQKVDSRSQIIIGITLKVKKETGESEVAEVIKKLDKEQYKIISLQEKAIKPI